MARKTETLRDPSAASPCLVTDPAEKARLEARNGLFQFDEVLRLIDGACRPGARFRLRLYTLQDLQRAAIQDIYTCAGSLRDGPVFIEGTKHEPPPHQDVLRLSEECCDYVNDHWDRSAVHLSAYVMWRVNWIHPFKGGNGRTSRAASYLVLCARLGHRLPGTLTIPEQIEQQREPYYAALDSADAAWANGVLDVSGMEDLLSHMLATQLAQVLRAATTS